MADITATLTGQVTITGELTVPMGIVPRGEIEVNENGEYDVTNYETANVAVPQPSGSVTITENVEHDVTDYVTADVQVPQPSGSIEITENGEFDVADFVQAVVDVQPQLNVISGTVTSSTVGQTLTITGIDHAPSIFFLRYSAVHMAYTANWFYIVGGFYTNGHSYMNIISYGRVSNSEARAKQESVTFSYSDGTVTLISRSTNTGRFLSGNYEYAYA